MKYVKTLDLNKTYSSKGYGDFVVLEDNTSRDVKIRFLSTGFEYITRSSDVKKGSVYDPYFPTKYGVGFLGQGKYHCSKRNLDGLISAPKAYYAWDDMLCRAYNPTAVEYAAYGGRGVFVNTFWHNFQNFAEWYLQHKIEDYYEIDKDILYQGNLEYGPNTCVMIPKYLNQGIAQGRTTSGPYLKGACKPADKDPSRKSERSKPFLGTWKNAPYYTTQEEAHFGWMAHRIDKIECYIEMYKQERLPSLMVIEALTKRVEILKNAIISETIIESFY